MDLSPALETVRGMADAFLAQLPNVGLAFVTFALFFALARGVRGGARSLSARYQRHQALGLVLGRLAQAAVVLVGLLVALSIALPSFRPAQVIQILGLSGVAIGFAFKDILQNFLAGILILLTEPFRLGDQIVFKDFEGTVEEIQTRATSVRTYDGRRVVIPNAELFTNAVTVNTAYAARRTEYAFGVGYGDDVEEARRILRGVMARTDGVLRDPAPEVLLLNLGESAVEMTARWWTHPTKADVLDVQDRVISEAKAALTRAGIDLPFPTRQVLLHDQTEETDGDRARQREGWPSGESDPAPRAAADERRAR